MADQPETPGDIPLSQLANIERMSVRTYNVCNVHSLHSLNAILEFYERVGTFTKLRNVGRLTEDELVGVRYKYGGVSPQDRQSTVYENLQPATLKWSDFTPDQLASVEQLFRMRIDALSARSRGVLKYIVPRIDANPIAYTEFFSDPTNQQSNSCN